LIRRRAIGLALLALAVCVVVVVFSVAWIDLPVASYASHRFPGTGLFHWTDLVLGSLRLTVPLAFLWLLVFGGLRLRRRAVPPWARTPLVASVSIGIAGAATLLFKYLFGRTPPYPTFLLQGISEWRPLRGNGTHMEFPSGTMAVATAALTVLGVRHPRFRLPSALVLAALALGLVVTNGHWVADLIAGVFLGLGVGAVTLPLCRRWRLESTGPL
jgi:membrane-associated phospholipid phosphatase